MSKIVCDISISADGFSAGNNQTEEHPFGDADESMLHAWMFDTPEENRPSSTPSRTPRRSSWAATCSARSAAIGVVTGRAGGGQIPPSTPPCSCSPTTSVIPWSWTVVQRSASSPTASKPRWSRRAPSRATPDVAIAGGASTINQYLAAGLLDELRLHITPFTLGAGTRIFDGLHPEARADLVTRSHAGHSRDLPRLPADPHAVRRELGGLHQRSRALTGVRGRAWSPDRCGVAARAARRNLYRIMAEPISANRSSPIEGSGPQRFGDELLTRSRPTRPR